MRKEIGALVASLMIASCATKVQFTLYEDGTKYFHGTNSLAPTNSIAIGEYQAIQKAPLGLKVTGFFAYTAGIFITGPQDIYKRIRGRDSLAEEMVEKCFLNSENGCNYNPKKGSEVRIN